MSKKRIRNVELPEGWEWKNRFTVKHRDGRLVYLTTGIRDDAELIARHIDGVVDSRNEAARNQKRVDALVA